MSDATKRAFESALEAHLADEGEGHLLSGYAIIAVGFNTANLDHRSSFYLTEYADGQQYHTSLGLAHQMVDEVKEWRDANYDNDDDDG